MRLQLDCLPCFLRQVLDASRLTGVSLEVQKALIKDVLSILKNFEKFNTPPELAREIHNLAKRYVENPDPYKEFKRKSIEMAKSVLNELKADMTKLNTKEERLAFAVKVSGIGNTFDAGVYSIRDFEKLVASIKNEIKKDFAVWHFNEFLSALKEAKKILIVGDNAGETVFDGLLAEELRDYGEVFYGVRGEPIINDATFEDAVESGLPDVAKVISTGCDFPGVTLKAASPEFKKIFEESDIVISKGQGNYESLSEEKKKNLFFLLKVKCPVIASHIGIGVGNYVFLSYT